MNAMIKRSRSGLYVQVQDITDPDTFQWLPVYICPEAGHMIVVRHENTPVYCSDCADFQENADDRIEPFMPRNAEEGESPLV